MAGKAGTVLCKILLSFISCHNAILSSKIYLLCYVAGYNADQFDFINIRFIYFDYLHLYVYLI